MLFLLNNSNGEIAVAGLIDSRGTKRLLNSSVGSVLDLIINSLSDAEGLTSLLRVLSISALLSSPRSSKAFGFGFGSNLKRKYFRLKLLYEI